MLTDTLCFSIPLLLFVTILQLFCPTRDDEEPLLHMSAVRRLQPQSSSLVFRYAAIRLLEVEIFLDRR